MIEIKELSKSFRYKQVLNNISFTLDNHIYALLGPNGSGKTTLLRIITHVIQGDGNIIYKNNQGEKVLLKDVHIGYLPQKFGLFKEMRLEDQMNYFACLKEVPKESRIEEVKRVLEAVNLYDQLDKKCGELSGGMIRRVGIAQAIMGNPDIILFDEPTVGLDPEERLRFKNVLNIIQGQCPILLSTHIVEDVESACQNAIVLSKGKIIFKGTLDKLKEQAKGRVIEVSNEIKLDSKEHYLINFHEKNNIKYSRLLILSKELCYQEYQVNETIEDGYMYLIKRNK